MPQTQLALIGHPITNSQSHRHHQSFIETQGLQADYNKIDVLPEQLPDFLAQAKQYMAGLSVTMPLKTVILPLLDEVHPRAKEIGAVNTVKFTEGKAIGYNTDSMGALKALQKQHPESLAGKNVIIVGAGGVAKAIAWALHQQGVQLTIINRTLARAEALAAPLNARVARYNQLPQAIGTCDVLIQATSIGMFDSQAICPAPEVPRHVLVMDVLSSPANQWLERLSQQGNLTASGRHFWIYQAIEQYNIWYDNQIDMSDAFNIFQNSMTKEIGKS